LASSDLVAITMNGCEEKATRPASRDVDGTEAISGFSGEVLGVVGHCPLRQQRARYGPQI